MSDAQIPRHGLQNAGFQDAGSHEAGRDQSGLHEALLADLVADLRPVRSIGKPWARTLCWLTMVLALALVLASFADMPAVGERLTAVPDMGEAVLGSVLTSILATIAVFQLALPDRSPRWALLPLPGLALWIGASGMGCARDWLVPGTSDASLGETMECLRFIIGLSVPMSVAIFWMLRQGYSLNPSLTGAMAGLATAAAAATLLNFFHPYDAALTDLLVHAVAVAIVVFADRFLARYVLGGQAKAARGVSGGPVNPPY